MARIFAFTISRADTPERGRLLVDTVSQGKEMAGCEFDWHLYANGGLAKNIGESLLATKLLQGMTVYETNAGQHPPCNAAMKYAQDGGYDYLLRIDDDCDFPTKRWLAKLIEASQAFQDGMILSPKVEGLKHPPPQSAPFEVEAIPVRIVEGAIGGLCRLHPMKIFDGKPYVSDVRLPMGGGDAVGIARWADKHGVLMAYVQSVRVKHAKTTVGQEQDDPRHFESHAIFQHLPYMPPWQPHS